MPQNTEVGGTDTARSEESGTVLGVKKDMPESIELEYIKDVQMTKPVIIPVLSLFIQICAYQGLIFEVNRFYSFDLIPKY